MAINQMKLTIPDLFEMKSRLEGFIQPAASIATMFPSLRRDRGVNAGFSGLLTPVHNTLCWVWLAILADESTDDIRNLIKTVVGRSLEAAGAAGSIIGKAEHNSCCLILSILADDRALLQTTLDFVHFADEACHHYQYYDAWSGVLKARLTGDTEREAMQMRILKRKKATSMLLGPSSSTVRAFVERDWKALSKHIRKTFADEYARAFQTGSLMQMTETTGVLYLRGRGYSHYWPWPEAVMAKIAARESITLPSDVVWLPDRLIR
jgi:hypothetical protein